MGSRRYNLAEEEVKKQEFLIALTEHRGVIKYACEDVDVSRSIVDRWRRDDKIFERAFLDCSEDAIDFVEQQLFAHMKRGSTAAVIFYLKTKAKHRGYVERSELTGAHGAPVMAQLDPEKLSTEALREVLENYDIDGA